MTFLYPATLERDASLWQENPWANAALNDGTYFDISMNSTNQIMVAAMSMAGLQDVEYFTHDTPIWVDASTGAEGKGWKDDPYPTLQEAFAAMDDPFPGQAAPTIPLNLAAGAYPSGTLDPPAPVVLSPTGGSAIFGE